MHRLSLVLVCFMKLCSKTKSSFDYDTTDIGKKIEVLLVKKDWFPKYVKQPDYDDIPDEWYGTVEEAHKILSNEELPVFDAFNFPLEQASVLFTDKQYGYDPTLPTIVAMQTMTGNRDSFFTKNTIRALGMRNFNKNYNLINVRFAQLQVSIKRTVVETYLGLHGNYEEVGKALSSFFLTVMNRKMMTPDQLNLIGFSYSAQLAGYIARGITQETMEQIHSIIGLDPYALGAWKQGVIHLSKTDAKVVQVIHTNSFMWGSLEERAHADIIVNNGNLQPGCFRRGFLPCSHARAAPLFWYLILFKSKFEGRRCSSYWRFWRCKCDNNPSAVISYPLNGSAKGTYYMSTLPQYPFGKGHAGSINCKPKKRKTRSHSKKRKGQ